MPSEQGAAIGSYTAGGGIAVIVGPLVGGAIVDQASWRWVFAFNVPLVAAALLFGIRAVPPSRAASSRHVDALGALLCVVGLSGVAFALIEQPRYGWGSRTIYLALLAGIASLGALVVHERRTPNPMLSGRLFSRRNFVVANLETLALYGGLSIVFFFLVIFLQQVACYSPLRSGLATLPATLVTFALSRRFGALADRFGPRLFVSVGPLIAATGIALLLRTGTHTSYFTDLLPSMLLFALGLSLALAPLTAAVMADADETGAGSIGNPRRSVAARECPGGQLCGVPGPAVGARGNA